MASAYRFKSAGNSANGSKMHKPLKNQPKRQGSFIAQLSAKSPTSFDLVAFPFVQQEAVNFFVNEQGLVEKLALTIPHRFVLNQWIISGDSVKKP